MYAACDRVEPPYDGFCVGETACLYAAQSVDGRCGARGPSTARTVATVRAADGSVVAERVYCAAFPAGGLPAERVITVITREQGDFRLGDPAPGVTALDDVTSDCP